MEQKYRFLELAEIVKCGDEYLNSAIDWVSAFPKVGTVVWPHEEGRYRRPIRTGFPVTPGEYLTHSGQTAVILGEVDGWAVGCVRYRNGRPPVGCTWHRETGQYWRGIGCENDLVRRVEGGAQ